MSLSSAVRRVVAGFAEDLARLPDAELLARGDEAAFAALVTRHGPAVLGTCRRILGHVQDAEDAAQAVFLVLAKNRRRVCNPAVLAAWLHGVAVRVSRKALGRRRKAEPLPEIPASESPDAVTWADARRVIDAALAELPEALRVPLVLCYLEGLTRDEAAGRLGSSLDTFRGRLERGRAKLRALLERRGFPLAAGLLAVLLESPASAAPAWITATAAAAAGAAPPLPAVVTLSTGVLPVTSPPLLRVLTGACAAALAVGFVFANQKPPEGQPPARVVMAEAPAVAPQPRPAPVARAEDLVGVWRAERVFDDGEAIGTEVIRVRRDAGELVAEWDKRLRSPGVDTNVLRIGPLAVTPDSVEFAVKSRFTGGEELPVPETKPLVVKFAWVGDDKSAFRLWNDIIGPGGATFDLTFRKEAERPKPAPDPLAPKALLDIDRKIRKEPLYVGNPHYLLVTFGEEAKFRVWLVKDDHNLYVDRNGNGDLTEDGERFPFGGVKENPPNRPRSFAVAVGDLTDAAGKRTHTDFAVSGIGTSGVRLGGAFLKLMVKVDGKLLQTAGPTNLMMVRSPDEARVVPFGAAPAVVRPSLALRTFPDANRAVEFCVQVGTPGIGDGAFAAYGNEHLAEGLGPTAEFVFAPAKADGAAKKLTLHLTDRCCGDHFFATVRVPDGAKTGLNAAKVTLSFPNCPWGKFEPTTFPLDVIPKGK